MINNKKWFAFFSHTGSEIVEIHKRTGHTPDCVVTNRSPGDQLINTELLHLPTQIKYLNNRPDTNDYLSILEDCDNTCLCTLHGWMRIMPKQVCDNYEMYNLHPGLISRYPELKGKDPQRRVCHETHDHVGVVVHRVNEGVDEGEILLEVSCRNTGWRTDQTLRSLALDAWLTFFDTVLKC